MNTSYEEPRKTLSIDFQNFIKETLFETKILDNMDQEFLFRNDDINPSINDIK